MSSSLLVIVGYPATIGLPFSHIAVVATHQLNIREALGCLFLYYPVVAWSIPPRLRHRIAVCALAPSPVLPHARSSSTSTPNTREVSALHLV